MSSQTYLSRYPFTSPSNPRWTIYYSSIVLVWLSLNSKFPPCDFFFFQKLDCPLLRLESYLTKFCFCSWSNMNPSLFNHFQEKWCTIKSHSIFQSLTLVALTKLQYLFKISYVPFCGISISYLLTLPHVDMIWSMENVGYEFLRLRSLLKTKYGWKVFDMNS